LSAREQLCSNEGSGGQSLFTNNDNRDSPSGENNNEDIDTGLKRSRYKDAAIEE